MNLRPAGQAGLPAGTFSHTPAELSFAALKGRRRGRRRRAGRGRLSRRHDLHAALMRIGEAAPPAATPFSRHSRRYHDDDDEDRLTGTNAGFTVAEVFDRALTLSHWSQPVVWQRLWARYHSPTAKSARAMRWPTWTRTSNAFRNHGQRRRSFEHGYQRAALVLWPQAPEAATTGRCRFQRRCRCWAAWCLRGWTGRQADNSLARGRALAAQMLIYTGPATTTAHGSRKDSAEAMMLLHPDACGTEHIDAMLASAIAAGNLRGAGQLDLVQALKLLPPVRVGILLLSVVRGQCRPAHRRLRRLAGTCRCRCGVARQLQPHSQDAAGCIRRATLLVLRRRPRHGGASAWTAGWIHDTLRAGFMPEHADLIQLADQAVTHLAWPKTFGLDTVIVPALPILAERPVLMTRPACNGCRQRRWLICRPGVAGSGAAIRLATRCADVLPLRALPKPCPFP